MQHDPAVEQELAAEFERDRVAYDSLPPRQQRAARIIAGVEFGGRRVVVQGFKAVIGVVEFAANLFLRLPYVLAGRLVTGIANRLVDGVKLGVRAAAGGARLALALARGGMALGKAALSGLEKAGMLSAATQERGAKKLERGNGKLVTWRDGMTAWRREKIEQIDRAWNKAKEDIRSGLHKAAEFCEYYGAIGLYRGTKFILNPRLPSGKPLLGSEKLNKAVGFATAACGFVFLSFELSKLFILGKIWHIKIAHSFIRDTAPLPLKILKQATIQPLLAAGLFSVKFLTLPAIAATRGALKSTRFTQGIAYQYNCRLRARHDAKRERALAREEAAKAAAAPKGRLRKTAQAARKNTVALSRYLHKKTFGFIGKFVEHIVEKSSPEFYEARIKHYQAQRQAAPLPALGPAPAPAPVPTPATMPANNNEPLTPAKPGLAAAPDLGQAFNQAQKDVPPATPPAPSLAPSVPPKHAA